MKKYKKEYDYSYTLGMFPSMELIHNRPNLIFKIVLSSKLEDNKVKEEIETFCHNNSITLETNDNIINKLSDKENCYVIAFFKKKEDRLDSNSSHIVLVNPSNIGNIGNIVRTILGFGINNLAIIKPAVDIYDPKSIRASMGAIFSTNIEYFESFEEYEKRFNNHTIYPFVLKGKKTLSKMDKPKGLYSLVFGNESSGLSDEFLKYDNTILIKHSNKIDSLNLTIAISVALYELTKDNFK